MAKSEPNPGMCPSVQVKTRIPLIPGDDGSLLETSYTWEGPTHCLEISPPLSDLNRSDLRMADLSLEQEEFVHSRLHRYKKKIDTLTSEVRSLKNQVDYRRELESELEEKNRDCMRKMLGEDEDHACSFLEDLEAKRIRQNQEILLRKLMEVEAEGAAAVQDVFQLKERVIKLYREGRDMLPCYADSLASHRESLEKKLEKFESANRTLRRLLREQQKTQMDYFQLSQEKALLQRKLINTEADNDRVVLKLEEKTKEVDRLHRLLDTEKDYKQTSIDLTKNLEANRASVQVQLLRREAENDRLRTQIRDMERAAGQQMVEMECLMEQINHLRHKAGDDQEALRRVAQAQKMRAEHSEEAAAQMNLRLFNMEKQMVEAQGKADAWHHRHDEEEQERRRLEAEVLLLKSQITALSEQLHTMDGKNRTEKEVLMEHLQGMKSENTSTKMQNQTLKATSSAVENKLVMCQSELEKVKDSIQQYESLVDGYKLQISKTQAEADEYRVRLCHAEKQTEMVKEQMEQQRQAVRKEQVSYLAELEPLKESLCSAQVKLDEAQERLRNQEDLNLDLTGTMKNLHAKMENQQNQVDFLKEKNLDLMDQNKKLQLQVERLERRLEEAGGESRGLRLVVSKLERVVSTTQTSLEEKNRERAKLSQQLEDALLMAKQQISEAKERGAIKDRRNKAKIIELESKLSRTHSEITQLVCSKSEMQQLHQSKLQDMKDRLEQADNTNRSLQNYVHFLKASYAEVFSDAGAGPSQKTSSP